VLDGAHNNTLGWWPATTAVSTGNASQRISIALLGCSRVQACAGPATAIRPPGPPCGSLGDAAARGRKVLWCSPTGGAAEQVAGAEVADTVAAVTEAHRRLTDGSWQLPAGSVVVIDNAATVKLDTIADIASCAAKGSAAVILLGGDDGPSPPGPSAALMRLLQEDLPWAVTLSVSDAAVHRHRRPPDLDAALVQATGTAPGARTMEIDDAVARREELRATHRSAYRVHTAWTRDSGRNRQRDDERERGV
jgi:AAA domain